MSIFCEKCNSVLIGKECILCNRTDVMNSPLAIRDNAVNVQSEYMNTISDISRNSVLYKDTDINEEMLSKSPGIVTGIYSGYTVEDKSLFGDELLSESENNLLSISDIKIEDPISEIREKLTNMSEDIECLKKEVMHIKKKQEQNLKRTNDHVQDTGQNLDNITKRLNAHDYDIAAISDVLDEL